MAPETVKRTIDDEESNSQAFQDNHLRICSCLACVYQVTDARERFGEQEKCVRVAFECSSNFLSASITRYTHSQKREQILL